MASQRRRQSMMDMIFLQGGSRAATSALEANPVVAAEVRGRLFLADSGHLRLDGTTSKINQEWTLVLEQHMSDEPYIPENERLLPRDLLSRASRRGNEFAWPIAEIPNVIDVAEKCGLVNLGGQLQFRIPDAGTCECHWILVCTYYSVPKELPYNERVEKTAIAARHYFEKILEEDDFIAEGKKGFEKELDEYENSGGNLEDAICFVWYVTDK